MNATNTLAVTAQSALTTDIANATDIIKTEAVDLKSESDVNVNVDISGGLAWIKDSVSFDSSGSPKGVNTITTRGTGSAIGNTLTANNVSLTGQEVNLNGSQITADIDAIISDAQVTTGAGEALVNVDSRVVKSTGPEAYIRGGLTGVELGVSLGRNQIIDEHNEYQAANSTIKSGNKASLNAEEGLSNQGTQITATIVDDVNTAKVSANISNLGGAVVNSSNNDDFVHKDGANTKSDVNL